MDHSFVRSSVRSFVRLLIHILVRSFVHSYGVWEAADLAVTLGQHDLMKVVNGTQTVKVKTLIVHDQFDEMTNDNDIALMELESDVIMTDHIHPACLSGLDVPDETICLATGWGSMRKKLISRNSMNVVTGVCHCSNWKTTIPFRVNIVLDPQVFVDFR